MHDLQIKEKDKAKGNDNMIESLREHDKTLSLAISVT